jgi:SanA protein
LEYNLCKIPSGASENQAQSLRAVSLKPEATASGGDSSLFLLKRYEHWLVLMAMLPLALLMAWRAWLNFTYQPYTSLEQLPAGQVTLVFGAEVRHNRPSAVLADRVEAAVALYHAGKVQKLLMSGDNRYLDYNEPAVMRAYTIELKVPAEDIILDYAGRRTYDSCYRAGEIFGLEAAILVTQAFHQARAAYLCQQLGVKAVGYSADKRLYLRRLRLWWEVRETLARR